jgi:signal transduction histidine kinase
MLSDTHTSENQEDRRLAHERHQADQTESRDREARDKDLSAVSAEEQIIQLERAGADKVRNEERMAADIAKKRERRRLRLATEALLTQERGTTDDDLLSERAHADRNMGREATPAFQTHELASAHNNSLAIVSHDLRNPLASIAMASEFLELSLQEPEVEREGSSEFVAIIQRNTAMMERMIADLLDVERIASDKIEIKRSKQSIEELFKDCEDLFASVALKNSISLNISVPSEPLEMDVDADRILQVMSNLIGNALKHTPKGGKIDVEASSVDKWVVVSVKDSGPGISALAQKKIFDKFSQLGINTRQGLGLGLYISKWIVEAHGGTIAVLSEPEHGSTFTFMLPT